MSSQPPQYPGPPGQPPPPPQGQPPYQQPQYQPGQPQYQGYVQRRTNGLAVASLVLGIVGLLLFGIFMIPNILAVIFGFVAISQINRAPAGTMGGKGMAIAGIVTGFVGIAFFILVVAFGTVDYHFGPTG